MKNTLAERVIENQNKKIHSKPRCAKTEFIALQVDIVSALEAGCSMKAIWETLQSEKKFSYGYKAFRNYVVKLIKLDEKTTRAGDQEKETPKSKMKGFTYDPIPNLEELV